MANRNRYRLSGFFLQTHATDSQQRDSARGDDPSICMGWFQVNTNCALVKP